jgi:hypothetical protein
MGATSDLNSEPRAAPSDIFKQASREEKVTLTNSPHIGAGPRRSAISGSHITIELGMSI